MKKIFLITLFCCMLSKNLLAGTVVEMKTSLGRVQIELNDSGAPLTVKNFLDYVDQKFYDGTIFHRVIKGFMIQGGGYDRHEQRKTTLAAIKNEADNGYKNIKGTVAMARTAAVNSATSQFFINLADNNFLDYRGRAPKAYGYAVFGRVIAGMDVVEKIGSTKTIAKSPLFKDFPESKVVIESIRRLD